MMRLFKAKDDKSKPNNATTDKKETHTHKTKLPLTRSASTRSPHKEKSSERELPTANSCSKIVQHDVPAWNKHKTQIAVRLNQAALRNPKTSGRSQDVVPLLKDCERMRKNLHELIDAACAYRKSMLDLETSRTKLFHKAVALSGDTHFTQLVATETGGAMKGTLVTLQEKFSQSTQKQTNSYQETVIEYIEEWETVVRKMTDEEVSQTHKLQKIVQHYEDKVEKLRNQVNDKENQGKSPTTAHTEKLQRNENKLSQAWKDYDTSAARTANLLEEATRMGWKDLHPLLQAMITFEQERHRDESSTWNFVGTIQDELLAIVAQYEEATSPPPRPVSPLPVHYESPTEEEEEEEEEDTVDSTEAVTEIHVNSSDPDVMEESPAEDEKAEEV